MRKMKKILATTFAIGALFIGHGVYACSGSMIACTSWTDQMNSDVANNCHFEVDIDITWLAC